MGPVLCAAFFAAQVVFLHRKASTRIIQLWVDQQETGQLRGYCDKINRIYSLLQGLPIMKPIERDDIGGIITMTYTGPAGGLTEVWWKIKKSGCLIKKF